MPGSIPESWILYSLLAGALALSILLTCAIEKKSIGESAFLSISIFVSLFMFLCVLKYRAGLSPLIISTVFFLFAVIILFILKRNRGFSISTNGFRAARSDLALLAIMAASGLTRVLLMWHTEAPLGDDARFHCLYSECIRTAGKVVYSMKPFDPLPLSYPWGLATLLAGCRDFTGVQQHIMFKALLVAISAFSVLGVYVIARRISRSDSISLWAAVFYGLVANYGGIDYIRWGGLANAIVMLLTMALINILLIGIDRESGLSTGQNKNASIPRASDHIVEIIICAIMLEAILAIHGIAGLLPCALIAICAAVVSLSKVKFAATGRAFASIISAFALCAVVSPDILKNIFASAKTSEYNEVYISVLDFPLIFNIVFCAAAVAGFAIVAKTANSRRTLLLLSWNASLLIGYVVSRYVFGFLSFVRTGSPTPMFLPSRLITDMAYPCAIFAGYGFSYACSKINGIDDRAMRAALMTAAIVVVLQAPLQQVLDKWGQSAAPVDAMSAFKWIRMNSPDDTLVINDSGAPASLWAPYMTNRVTTLAPRPFIYHIDKTGTEDAIREVRVKEEINSMLFETGDADRMNRWLATSSFSDFLVYTEKKLDLSNASEVFRSGSVLVYRIKVQR